MSYQNLINFKIYGTQNDLMECPYDSQHSIPRKRFPVHLADCRSAHPELAKDILICRYSAMHHVHRSKMKYHLDHECLLRQQRDMAEIREGRPPVYPPWVDEKDSEVSGSDPRDKGIDEKLDCLDLESRGE